MSNQPINVDKILMRQINDKANGGFIMFSFGEDGYPVVNSHFDDASKALALQHYITNWSMAVDAVTLENTVADMENQMMDDMPPPPDIEDEDNPFDDLD
tara:strand:- start:50 stop:346 length:297 start_codon:yes stop_codon:yes gene_type:complete